MPKSLRKQTQDSHKELLASDYVTMEAARQATGFSDTKVLTWAEQHNVKHYKYQNRWYFLRADLLRALQE